MERSAGPMNSCRLLSVQMSHENGATIREFGDRHRIGWLIIN